MKSVGSDRFQPQPIRSLSQDEQKVAQLIAETVRPGSAADADQAVISVADCDEFIQEKVGKMDRALMSGDRRKVRVLQGEMEAALDLEVKLKQRPVFDIGSDSSD